jgi:rubrerythrin
MQFNNLKEIIDFAIEKEEEAARFYEHAIEEESSYGSKEMFKELAQEEWKHKSFLENMEDVTVEKSLSEYDVKWIKNLKRSNYIVDMEFKKGMDYRDILILAMKREEKALELYNALLRQSAAESHKKLFTILCQEEAKHKLRLETVYDDYMAKMGD